MSFDFRREDFRPNAPESAIVGPVCLSADGSSLAYSMGPLRSADLFVSRTQGGPPRRLVACGEDARPASYSFSPDSERIAFLMRAGPPPMGDCRIRWLSLEGNAEAASVEGFSFAWMPGGQSLVIAEVEAGFLTERSVDDASLMRRWRLRDDGDVQFPPALAVSGDGERIAFTTRSVDRDVTEVWLIDGRDLGGAAELVTDIPGSAVRVQPFWSPNAETLGLFVVHLERKKSAIVLVPEVGEDGEVVYESGLLDAPGSAVFSPTGKHVFFMRTIEPGGILRASGPPSLVALRLGTGQLSSLTVPGEIVGVPRFSSERSLVVEGPGVAHVFHFSAPP